MDLPAIINWIFSNVVTPTALLAAAGFLFRTPLTKWLESAVAHRFDEKLEGIRSELRKDEDKFKAQLNARDSELDALRSGALSALAARQVDLNRKRLEAVEAVWRDVVQLGRFKWIVSIAAVIDLKELAKLADSGPSGRKSVNDFVNSITQSEGSDFANTAASSEHLRPFLSDIAWANFTAYRQLLLFPAAQLHLLKVGGSRVLPDANAMIEVLKTALPHRSAYLDEVGEAGLQHLVDELERQLLASLRETWTENESDAAAVQQAKRILEAVGRVATDNLAAEAKIVSANAKPVQASATKD